MRLPIWIRRLEYLKLEHRQAVGVMIPVWSRSGSARQEQLYFHLHVKWLLLYALFWVRFIDPFQVSVLSTYINKLGPLGQSIMTKKK